MFRFLYANSFVIFPSVKLTNLSKIDRASLKAPSHLFAIKKSDSSSNEIFYLFAINSKCVLMSKELILLKS